MVEQARAKVADLLALDLMPSKNAMELRVNRKRRKVYGINGLGNLNHLDQLGELPDEFVHFMKRSEFFFLPYEPNPINLQIHSEVLT